VLTGLNRYVYAPIAALALWAMVLADSPAMAIAQATHQTQGQQGIDREDRGLRVRGGRSWRLPAVWAKRARALRRIGGR
jgi:hypothetical protein